MSNIITYKNIQTAYTDIIKSYLDEGYEILFDDTSRGCKICTQLVNDELIPDKKLFIICENTRFDKWYDSITITVYLMGINQHFREDDDTIISTKTFYHIAGGYYSEKRIYTEDIEFARDCIDKKYKRSRANRKNSIIGLKPTSKLMNFVRTHKKFSAATKKGTKVYKNNNRYYIEFNGNKYYVEFNVA